MNTREKAAIKSYVRETLEDLFAIQREMKKDIDWLKKGLFSLYPLFLTAIAGIIWEVLRK